PDLPENRITGGMIRLPGVERPESLSFRAKPPRVTVMTRIMILPLQLRKVVVDLLLRQDRKSKCEKPAALFSVGAFGGFRNGPEGKLIFRQRQGGFLRLKEKNTEAAVQPLAAYNTHLSATHTYAMKR